MLKEYAINKQVNISHLYTAFEVYYDSGFSFDGENLLRDGKAFLKACDLRIPGKHNIANFIDAL